MEDCSGGVLVVGGVSGSDWLEDMVLVQVLQDSKGLPGQPRCRCVPVTQMLGESYSLLEGKPASAAAATSTGWDVAGGKGCMVSAGPAEDGASMGKVAGASGGPVEAGTAKGRSKVERGLPDSKGMRPFSEGCSQVVAAVHPLARRDYGGCAVGSQQLVVVGGFDGSKELLDIHVCTIAMGSSQHAEAGAPEHKLTGRVNSSISSGNGVRNKSASGQPGDGPTASSGSSSAKGSLGPLCEAVWEQVKPSNMALPVGRSHHSVCYHIGSASLLLFGGYSSQQGCLNELWQFNMVCREWWQPEVKGRILAYILDWCSCSIILTMCLQQCIIKMAMSYGLSRA